MITFKKNNQLFSCLVCGSKDVPKLRAMRIGRINKDYDSILTFDICTDCLQKMLIDIDNELSRC